MICFVKLTNKLFYWFYITVNLYLSSVDVYVEFLLFA